ncbi:DUF1345 domain-containing protein [Pseudonocardia nematodicida]|uniref:DUF1345 domain-containing protein n=1 Tax=Pseudonocardia nematodicida TaxID=1206997 RepID=A0ABV1K880_9PSEU
MSEVRVEPSDVVRWWNREWFRQIAGLLPAVPAFWVPDEPAVRVLVAWNVFAVVYLLLTWLTYRRRDPAELRALGVASRERRLAERLSLASSPEELPQLGATIALIAAVFVLPRYAMLDVPPGWTLGICIVAIVSCWLTMQVGFTIAYIGRHAERGGLVFPGDDELRLVDYLYFSVGIGATFGTTDVTVTTREMRRTVLTHSVLAFVFNTLILAATVSIVSGVVAG